MTGLVQLLAAYPEAMIESILSPLSGVPAKHKFLPSISEIREELESRRPLPSPRTVYEVIPPDIPKDPAKQPTFEELKAKYGENWGLHDIGKRKRREYKSLTNDDLRELYRKEGNEQ